MIVSDKYMAITEVNLKKADKLKQTSYLCTRTYSIESDGDTHKLDYTFTYYVSERFIPVSFGTMSCKAGCKVSGVARDSEELAQIALDVAKALQDYIVGKFNTEYAKECNYAPEMEGIMTYSLSLEIAMQNDDVMQLTYSKKGRFDPR